MVAHGKIRFVTPEKYLQREVQVDNKNEYVNGEIVAMSGASPEHALITANIAGELYPHFKRAGCRDYTSDIRIRIEVANRFYYPDYAVVCGIPLYAVVGGIRSLANPTLLVEVLSSSTERRDRGEKWLAYKQIESLTTYILVHQDKPLVEMFTRHPGAREWTYAELSGLDETLCVAGIEVELPLSDLYRDVLYEHPTE